MANTLALLVTSATTVVAIATFSAGCMSEAPAEDEGTSSSAQTATATTQCAAYPKNPACDAQLFLYEAVRIANEDPKANVLEPITNAKTCIRNLIAAGGVVAGTGGVGAVVVTMATAVKGVETFYACKELGEYFDRIGLTKNISCWLEPVVNDKSVQLCECTQTCNRGVDREGVDGRYHNVKLRYGYLDRIGSAKCYCTNDPKEVRCQWSCSRWASTRATDCTCATP